MTITVLVPDEHGVTALAGVEGITVVRYDPAAPPPTDAEVLVPSFLAETDPAAYCARLPSLRLIQLQTTGAENWVGRIPEHVLLSTARGAHGGSTAEWALGALITIYREFIPFERARQVGSGSRTSPPMARSS